MTTLTERVFEAMLSFQKENNTIQMCITNTAYLVCVAKQDKEITKKFSPAVKAVIAITDTGICLHVVMSLNDNQVVDPSEQFQGATYVDRFCDLPKDLEIKTAEGGIRRREDYLTRFVKFLKQAQEMNEGKFEGLFHDYAVKQHAYVMGVLSKADQKQLKKMCLPLP